MLFKLRAILLTAVFLLFNFSFFSDSEVLAAVERDYTYSETKANITITKYTGRDKDIEIPSTIVGKPVTTIGNDAFYGHALTNVTIPSSVTTIGSGAFYGNALTNVTIADGVTTIGQSAFARNELTNVTIPSSVTSLRNRAFANNPLNTVTFLNSETVLGTDLFGDVGNAVKLIGYNPSTAKDYAIQNSYLFEEIVPETPSTEDTATITTEDTATILTGTGWIELTVLKQDKKTAISEPLQVMITDKSGRFVTRLGDKLSNGKFTSINKLPKGTYYVTLSDGKISQTTTVKVGNKKVAVKPVWATTLESIKDSKGVIKNFGAIKGVVYDTEAGENVVKDALVKIVSKNTTWSTVTDSKGSFNVFVPKGTYSVIIEGQGTDKQNSMYKNIKVQGGLASSPLETMTAGVAWGDQDKTFGFVLNEDSVTGKSKALTGKATPTTTVAVYTTVSGDTAKIWVAETKVKKNGVFSIKIPSLSGKQIVFVAQDEAGNQYVSDVKDVPKIDAPSLSASAAKGKAAGTTKIKVSVSKGTNNTLLVITSKGPTAIPKLGDAAPTATKSAILFKNYTSNEEIVVNDATHAAVYEISASGEIVKFKDIPLAGKINN